MFADMPTDALADAGIWLSNEILAMLKQPIYDVDRLEELREYRVALFNELVNRCFVKN